MIKNIRYCFAGCLALLATISLLHAQQAGSDPVKIFILAGQSNMVGQGVISPDATPGTLEYTVANDPEGKYQFLVDGSGDWVVRDDVWIIDQDGRSGGLQPQYDPGVTRVGPEIGFGHFVGDLYEEQVLIIKTAWGGRSLGHNFLPPSSGPYPEPLVDGDAGWHYKRILEIVADVTTNLGTYFPDYNGNGYEIVGFCWHQGWNDRIDSGFSAAYETNMANFINDIRSDLSVPNMPFVIASSALDGWIRYTQVEDAQLIMADAGAYPAFSGNVASIDARQPYNDLTFWQLSSDSPQNEGFHWNRNAKTYTNLGLAMGDAMSLMVEPRCPYRLQATGDASGVTLTWEDGTEAATSVEVLRDAGQIAASAPISPPSYLDAGAQPGVIEYQLNFTMSGTSCPPLTLTFDAGITDLEAYRSQNSVKLNWTNNLGYTNIEVRRGGVLIDTIAGTATSYEDTAPPASGDVTYSVVPTNGSAAQTEVIINLDGLSPGNSYIYEAFEDSDFTLNENVSGSGLSSRWGGGLHINAGSMSYGPLPTSGNQSFNNGGNTSSGVVLNSELEDAGLLDHGSELWFSFLTNNTTGVNTAVWFCLGTDRSSFFTGMEDGGEGIGVNLAQGGTPKAATWAPGRSEGSSTGSIATDTTALVVGKITWGADGASNDTIEIYLPDLALTLGSPVSTTSAVLDQSQFNVLSMGGKNAGSPKIDEIRFAANYNDVIATDLMVADEDPPTPSPMTWETVPTADGDSSISMTATTASDPAGVEYFFDETSGNPGGTDSGWQDSPSYTDTGLDPDTTYTYTVIARDKSVNQNETAVSTPAASATTDPVDNVAPATPGFDVLPTAVSYNEITMTATTVTDPSGVEYFFDETSGNPGGTDSGWQDSPTYNDTGLDPETTYTYTVTARDKSTAQNPSAPSSGESATTDALPTGPGGAIIYEPFDDADGSLNGNTPGLGLDGTWSSDSASVVAGSVSYGALGTSGNKVTFGSSYGTISPGSTLDGFLDDGDTLWFSCVVFTGTDVGTNPDIGFAFGTNRINDSNNLPMSDGGDGGLGIGFTIKNGQVRASWWDASDDNNAELKRQTSGNSGNSISTSTAYLIAGEMIFGATDTINIYKVDTDLNLGSVVSSVDVAMNQTLFDTISFAAKGAGAPHTIDEIRFGTTFEEAIGLGGGGGSDYETWDALYSAADLSDPNGDFDGDGQTNDEERIWGTDPTSGASTNPIAVQLNPGAGTFSYTRRDDSLTGLTYTIWTSPDLTNWTEDTGAIQSEGTPDANDVETVDVTVSGGLLGGAKLFVQVRAE